MEQRPPVYVSIQRDLQRIVICGGCICEKRPRCVLSLQLNNRESVFSTNIAFFEGLIKVFISNVSQVKEHSVFLAKNQIFKIC